MDCKIKKMCEFFATEICEGILPDDLQNKAFICKNYAHIDNKRVKVLKTIQNRQSKENLMNYFTKSQ